MQIVADCVTIKQYNGNEYQVEGVEITNIATFIDNVQKEYGDVSSLVIVITLPKTEAE